MKRVYGLALVMLGSRARREDGVQLSRAPEAVHGGVQLGFRRGELKGIGMAPAWTDAAGALAAFREGCSDALFRVDGGVDSTCLDTSWWRPVMAIIVCADFLAKDETARDGPVDFLQLSVHWNLSMSVLMQVPHLHTRNGMIDSILIFFTQDEAALYRLCWSGCVSAVHGMNELLQANILCHLHQHFEDAPNLNMSSICGTRFSLMDVYSVDDIVLLLFEQCHRRWTTAPSLLILRFNGEDPLNLSSVKAIRNLQLNSHQPQVHTLERPLGESTTGHQLVWSTKEALGDYNCSKLESGLSPKKRPLFDSFCNLWYLLHKSWSYTIYYVQPTTACSCSLLSFVILYWDR